LIQMIGRGMRLHAGKQNCHIIDMVASLETGIVTTPTLFGLDPNELVNEASTDKMFALSDSKEAEKLKDFLPTQQFTEPESTGHSYNVTFTEYDTVFDLIADTSGEQHIRNISRHSWVRVSPEKYILNGPEGTYLKLEETPYKGPDHPKFRAYEVRALPAGVSKSPYAAPREILTAATFDAAVHGCDEYARENYPFYIITGTLPWRKAPATAGQLKLLNKLRGTKDELGPEDVTKGKAADMITKLKHGARGRFATIEALRKKMQKSTLADEQYRTRQLNERVTVGPVSA
jgi:ATP-dependent helicase IRC3